MHSTRICGAQTSRGTVCQIKVSEGKCRYHSTSKHDRPPKKSRPQKEAIPEPEQTTISVSQAMNTWPKYEDFWDNYVHISEVAKGGYGSVSKIQDSKTKTFYALKILTESDTGNIKDDSVALSHFKHKNIVKFYKKAFIPHYNSTKKLVPMVLLEFVDGCTFQERKTRNPKKLKKLLLSALKTLRYIHSKNVIHHDIKPANLIIRNDEVTFLDFGIASIVNNKREELVSKGGTRNYMAPEVFGLGHTKCKFRFFVKADIFGLGVTFYRALVLKSPGWVGKDKKFNYDKFNKTMESFQAPEKASETEKLLYKTIKSMLSLYQQDRPSVNALISDLER